MNIVKLGVPAAGYNTGAIELLERLLEQAKVGKIAGLAVAVDHGASHSFYRTGLKNFPETIGYVRLIEHELIHEHLHRDQT